MRVQARRSFIDAPQVTAETARPRFDRPPLFSRAPGPPIELPALLRPIVGRDLPKRIFQEVLRKRAVPLLKRLVAAQAELRGERADRARERSRALLESIRTFDLRVLEKPDLFFDRVVEMSKALDGIIDDADYAVFGQIGLLHQLRALNVGLRSSRGLWHTVRMGSAMRDPELQRQALALGGDAQSVLDRGWRGGDITDDLARLEQRFGDFKTNLDEEMGRDSGLSPAFTGLRVSRRAWTYRLMLERAIAKEQGRPEAQLSNRELCEWVRVHGVPHEVIAEIYATDILPILRSIEEDPTRNAHAEAMRTKARALADMIEQADPETLRTADQIEAFTIEIGRALEEILIEAEQVTQPADGIVRRLRESRSAAEAVRVLLLGLRVNETVHNEGFVARARSLLDEVQAVANAKGDADRRLGDLERHLIELGDEAKALLHVERLPALDQSLSVLRAVRKAVRLRDAAGLALNPAVREAADAFGDLEMSAERRREIYDRALGEPLLETVVGLLLAMREVESRVHLRRPRSWTGEVPPRGRRR